MKPSRLLPLVLLLPVLAASQNWNSPKTFFNISPQLGGTTAPRGDLFAGGIGSYYWHADGPFYLGMGMGSYFQGDELVGETLAKISMMGVLGASVGASFSADDGARLTNDLWGNALFAGIRWRMDHRPKGTIHSVAAFVPLGLFLDN